ncbi:LIM-domain binding protein-domain-containing protein [Crucibulum laeve]|uniref:LIM-domain binding protein-domain-containing protein n=1 Tax=Crucibulum laeve TaxID=68775 RepID=A0A5C3MPH8_9AGAR|nr:LIM-domain binding protein-domain-containing protein [Crucibulum laeve]
MNANLRGDMLRSGGMPQAPNMLSMGNTPFMQGSMPPGQQLGPNSMGLQQNGNNGGQPMGMLNPGNPIGGGGASQQFGMPQMTAQQFHIQQQRMRGQNTQGLNPATMSLTGPPMAGLGTQVNRSFPGGMVQGQLGTNVSVRRVPSHPSMGQPHISNMPPNMGANLPMGMNAQESMPSHLRQLGINRQQASQGMPQNMNRPGPGPTQAMNSLTQPPSMGPIPHLGGMQRGHPQNNFGSVPLTAQHQQPQLSSSPRPGSLPPHTPSMMSTPGPSHTPVNHARRTPDNAGAISFMNFGGGGTQFPSGPNQRMPPNGGQYPLGPSSTPPISMADTPMMSAGLINPQGGTPTRAGFQVTPAQQFEQMRTANPDGYNSNNSSFGMPPPRPPSQHNPIPQQQPQQPSQQQPAHHPSPMQTDPTAPHPQRPQSQQSMQGRPPSTPGRVQTPRQLMQSHPPPPNPGSLTAIGRLQQPQPPQPPQIPGAAQHLPIAPRPPPPPTAVSATTAGPSTQPPQDTPPSNAAPIPRPQPPPANTVGLGHGQGLIRLLQFSGILSSENKTKLQLSWWNDLVRDYFTPKAVMKFTLWKDNQRNEAKPFEIGVPILPRFFLVTTQSGVKSMTLSLDGARERMYAQGHAVVECVTAVWTYKYNNGYTVTLRGPLTAHVVITTPSLNPSGAVPTLKFDDFQFDANLHDKYIALESIVGPRAVEAPKTPRVRSAPTPTPMGSAMEQQQREEDKKWEEPRVIIERGSIPGEPVNAFGIPQATMRCLELAESVGAMADLITFAAEQKLGPKDALTRFAHKIRDTQPLNNNQQPLMNGMGNNHFNPFPPNGIGSTTLYSSAPPSVTNPQTNPPASMNSPQNMPSSAVSSPQKQHKTIPQASQSASSSVTAASPAVSSGTANNTPALANASLKRKQTSDTASPTTGPSSDQPPQKRAARKRGGTRGTG